MDNLKLKLCPFCGEEWYKADDDGGMRLSHKPSCYLFGYSPNIGTHAENSKFLECWNQRAVDGETSDGYHTFNELYHHRAVLFSKVVEFAGERAGKSKLHADGTMFDGYFIVGVETPEGQATYHYAIEPYWEMFDCKEVEHAPVWDGHTPQEAIARIEHWNQRAEHTCKPIDEYCCGVPSCGNCGVTLNMVTSGVRPFNQILPGYCHNCGARVVK